MLIGIQLVSDWSSVDKYCAKGGLGSDKSPNTPREREMPIHIQDYGQGKSAHAIILGCKDALSIYKFKSVGS